MASTVEKYRQPFKDLGIELEWHPVWLPSSSHKSANSSSGVERREGRVMGYDMVQDDDSESRSRKSGCTRFDNKGGPTLRFIFN